MKHFIFFLILTASASAQFPMVAAWNGDSFKPTDIVGIKGWYVARDLIDSVGKANGDTLHKWNNRIMPVFNAVQATGAKKPTVQDSAGLVSIVFDGVDDALLAAATVSDTLPQPNTVFIVIRIKNSAANQVIIDGNALGVTGPRNFMVRGFGAAGVLNIGASTSFAGPAITSDSTYVIGALYSVANSYISANKNGVFGDVGISEFLPIVIGARYGGATTPAGVKVYEIIYYSGALSATDYLKVQTYLANKYGVTL